MDNTVIMPDLLIQLIKWQNEVAPELPSYETATGYFFKFDSQDNGGYRCSPVDSIMFATTGVDGIHFSLLTDFGRVTNLNEAPVICVSPMEFGDGIRIVAKNIRDVFALHFSGHENWFCNYFQNREAYLQFLRRTEEEHANDQALAMWKKRKELQEKAVREFNFNRIEDPFEYIQEVHDQRSRDIVLQTSDSLGVTPLIKRKEYIPHPWQMKEIPSHRLHDVKEFVNGAEIETLLSFIRDCQAQYVDHIELIQLLHKKLNEYGLSLEAHRLMNCMNV